MFRYPALQLRRCVAGARLINQSAPAAEPKKSHYEVLGLSPFASQDEIRNAFLKLSKEIHPDANASDPDSHSKFVRVNEAYAILSKLQTRREYDVKLAYSIRDQNLSSRTSVNSTVDDTKGERKGIGSYVMGALTAAGIVYFIFSLYRTGLHLETIRNSSAENARQLKELREQARANGKAKQIELLQEKFAAAEARRQAIVSSYNK